MRQRLISAFNHDPATPPRAAPPDLIRAAVLIALVERAEGHTVLLTRRTEHLHDHPGQISFPGGRREASDRDAAATALREAHEEIGLATRFVRVIGQLAPYQTSTGFVVDPVVALVQPEMQLTLDDFEVAEVFEAPLDYVLAAENRRIDSRVYGGKRRKYFVIEYQGHVIWGATAGMLVRFANHLQAP